MPPALFDGTGLPEILRQGVQRELRVEHPAEDPIQDEAARGPEFDVAQGMNGKVDSRDDQDEDEADQAVMQGADYQREHGAGARGGIEQEHDAAWGEAFGEQTVVDMTTVGCENGLLAQEAAHDSQPGIEQGNREHEQGRGETEQGGGLLAPKNGAAAEEEPQRQAAAIAQKDGGGIKVETEEAEEGAHQGSGGIGERHVILEHTGGQGGGGGKQHNAGRQAIHAVDQVDGIGTGDEPEHGGEHGEPRRQTHAHDSGNLKPAQDGEQGGDDFTGEFLPGLEAADIVPHADDEDHREGGEHRGKR